MSSGLELSSFLSTEELGPLRRKTFLSKKKKMTPCLFCLAF